MRYILSLLIAIALFCPVDADAGLVRNNFMPTTGGTFTGPVTITGGDLTIKAASGAAGTHTICSDAAEDNNDCWKIEVAIDGGVMTLESNASGSYVVKVTLTTDGDVTTTGTGTFDKIATAASEDPLLQMSDSDAGDGDVGFEIDVDATATGTGAEDYDVDFKAQIAGSLDRFAYLDADSSVALDNGIDATLQLGTIAVAATPRLYAATYTSAETLEVEECYNSTIYISGATVITLPVMQYGMKVTFITLTANAISVDTNGADDTDLDGVASGVGEKSTSQSGVGEIVVYTWLDADGWYAASDGWTDGGA